MRDLLRAWWPYLAAGVAVLVAFCAGRFSAPVKVEERLVEKVVVQEKLVEKRFEVAVKAEERVRVVYRDRIVRPDGTREEREVERDESASSSATVAAKVREVERVVYRDREVVKVVESARPLWRVSLLAGVDLPRLHHPQLLGPIAFGAQVERRLIGPAFVGAYALSSGQGGVTVGVEF